MPKPFHPGHVFLALLALAAWPALSARADGVTVYRCIGKGGSLALRDTPCLPGETQQVLNMARPRDPPPRPPVAAPITPPPPAPAPVREVVVVRAPLQPMYECTNAENGQRYTSDNGEGNPRWVPLWTLGYPARTRVPTDRPAHGYVHAQTGSSGTQVSAGFHSGGGGHAVVPTWAGMGGGTWIRDTCHMLPPQEVCARLSDRKYEIMRRYNSALQSERQQLDLEQRGIEARMANDCGTY